MPKIYLNTKIDKIGRQKAVSIANMALRWCRRTLGTNKRKKHLPKWYIQKSIDLDSDYHYHGEYDPVDNEIYIYWDTFDTVADLISTCIHEWTHQLQPLLTKYDPDADYESNPYELEARQNESLHGPACWDYIKNKLNSKPDGNRDLRTKKAKGSRSSSNEKNKKNEGRKAKMDSSKGTGRNKRSHTYSFLEWSKCKKQTIRSRILVHKVKISSTPDNGQDTFEYNAHDGAGRTHF